MDEQSTGNRLKHARHIVMPEGTPRSSNNTSKKTAANACKLFVCGRVGGFISSCLFRPWNPQATAVTKAVVQTARTHDASGADRCRLQAHTTVDGAAACLRGYSFWVNLYYW